jgi:hypothetical protein
MFNPRDSYPRHRRRRMLRVFVATGQRPPRAIGSFGAGRTAAEPGVPAGNDARVPMAPQ